MRSLSVVVLGAGVAGLSAALALARHGHGLTLVERDAVSAGDALDAPAWPRAGIAHFLQPHAFIPRGRLELRDLFPDVLAALLEAGAWEVDLRPKIPGPLRPEDEELAYIGVRRPIVEWALWKAVLADERVRVLSPVRATGLRREAGGPPRVTGVATSQGDIEADLVVDAMGRRSPTPAWLAALGASRSQERSSDCGIIYYSRYYRVRPGVTLPDGPWIPGPRGDLGYGAFSTFPGDNGTFAAIIAIPPGANDLKGLRHVTAFEAAASSMPALYSWTNADTAEPITDVLAMGSLRNTVRDGGDREAPVGLVRVGDAICHTDPVLALGLSFSLIHARTLATALHDHAGDLGDAAAAFATAIRPEIEERYAQATDLDAARSRRWAGEPVDIGHRDGGAYEVFAIVAGYLAGTLDADVFRAVARRHTFLDRVDRLNGDAPTLARIEALFAELSARPRPRPGPERDELVELVARSAPTPP